MTRYTKQPNKWTCGPVSLVNTLKWAEYPVTWEKDGDRLTRMSGTYHGFGSEVWRFYKILEAESEGNVTAWWNDGAKIKDLDKWVKHDNKCAIIVYRHKRGSHAFLCTGKTEHYYTVVNLHRRGSVYKRIHRKSMIKLLRRFPKSNSIVFVEKTPSDS